MRAEADDVDRLAAEVGAALSQHGWILATAESCTGGGVAEAITRVAGSSAWFDRGFITYSNAAKHALLAVSEASLAAHGAVSEVVALEMARGAVAASPATIAIAITGIAGPGGATPGKPVGMVCFAWARRDGTGLATTLHFAGDRAAVRTQAVNKALELVLSAIQ